ncbi:hypothetical protein [Pseudomonas petrae]|uniref:Uncharacterized protein n=1 Tax=Pseudomonas petrae TaxID=2912190 RepID=A0ABS9IC61_9PSED|nr:hypothetical protein [Pseudomonas petrae]MCF7545307.1 hypothetical protein [Pseudomonas petrae]
MHIAVWVVVLFFAVSWTVGMLVSPQHRMKSTIAALAHWWISIAVIGATGISVYHLLWMMPLALMLCMVAMNLELTKFKARTFTIFLKAAVVVWPATFFLLRSTNI